MEEYNTALRPGTEQAHYYEGSDPSTKDMQAIRVRYENGYNDIDRRNACTEAADHYKPSKVVFKLPTGAKIL